MGLDLNIKREKPVICPECGMTIGHTVVDCIDSNGRVWYPFLEAIGYYVPYNRRTKENEWYGKDMLLTAEQTKDLYRFVQKEDVYLGREIEILIAMAMIENDAVVVNANW